MVAKMKPRIGAVILAAGSSSRMGEAKQLLRLGATTLLDQVTENVRGSRVDEIVLVLGHEAETIKQTIATKKLKIVVNESYRQGMGTSLRAGLSALPSEVDAALIVLADQPFVRSETFNQIIDHYQQSNAQIVIPTYNGFRGNPVLLDRSVFSEVMALQGDIGCRAIFGSHLEGIVKVPVEDIGILLDLDSKDDVARLKDFRHSTTGDGSAMEAADLKGREIAGDAQPYKGPELVIVGKDPLAVAMAKLGKLMRFAVTIVDPFLKSSDLPEADRFAEFSGFFQAAGRLCPLRGGSQPRTIRRRGGRASVAREQRLHRAGRQQETSARDSPQLGIKGRATGKIGESTRSGRTFHRGGNSGGDCSEHHGRDRF